MGAAEDDFAARCVGAVRYFNFDTVSQLGDLNAWGEDVTYSNNEYPDGHYPEIDTSVKCSGAGSMKFTYPSNSGAGESGHWCANFSENMLTQFGPGEDFYVQWRQRFELGFLTSSGFDDSDGWKQCIINVGDFPTSNPALINYTRDGVDIHRTSSNDNCEAEIVQQNLYMRRVTWGYCGQGVQYAWDEDSGGEILLQNQMPGCTYDNVVNHGTLAYCLPYYPDEWMTFQLHIRVGTWNSANGTLELWVAREGQTSSLVTRFTNMTFPNVESSTHVGYGKIFLLPYCTNKNPGLAHTAVHTWYDELIISTARIADPGASAPVGTITLSVR